MRKKSSKVRSASQKKPFKRSSSESALANRIVSNSLGCLFRKGKRKNPQSDHTFKMLASDPHLATSEASSSAMRPSKRKYRRCASESNLFAQKARNIEVIELKNYTENSALILLSIQPGDDEYKDREIYFYYTEDGRFSCSYVIADKTGGFIITDDKLNTPLFTLLEERIALGCSLPHTILGKSGSLSKSRGEESPDFNLGKALRNYFLHTITNQKTKASIRDCVNKSTEWNTYLFSLHKKLRNARDTLINSLNNFKEALSDKDINHQLTIDTTGLRRIIKETKTKLNESATIETYKEKINNLQKIVKQATTKGGNKDNTISKSKQKLLAILKTVTKNIEDYSVISEVVNGESKKLGKTTRRLHKKEGTQKRQLQRHSSVKSFKLFQDEERTRQKRAFQNNVISNRPPVPKGGGSSSN